jgi:dihydrolipoamide dehydrogenase
MNDNQINKGSNNLKTINAQVLVIGSGPGGYTAAFRAADLGKQVVLLEQHKNLGGVCLNVGCIPSKALLNIVHVLEQAKELSGKGILFDKPKIDIAKMRSWVVNKTINKLTMGLKSLAALRKVNVLTGHGKFINSNRVEVIGSNNEVTAQINFEQAIIAVGSRPIELPNIVKDPRIMDSTKALEMQDIPENLLIIGGGIIGMELGTVYAALGSKISVVELTNQLLPGADLDLVDVWFKRMQSKFSNFFLNTKVENIIPNKKDLEVVLKGEHSGNLRFNKVLCAIGRRPNADQIDADQIGLAIDQRGFIIVDQQMRTNVPHIFAIGDVAGQPMLAHKAIPEGKVAAEVICGKASYFDTKLIPNVAYTIPEVSWVGLTEEQCKLNNMYYEKAIFPWAASGRALATDQSDGFTKILFNKSNKQIIGAGIVGDCSSELIAEVSIAMEMGATCEDLGSIIHPHPTISESIVQAAELFAGTITDLPNIKKLV